MSTEKHTPQDFIPKPCLENWNEMSGDDQRRHCEECDTHVVDLTGLSTNDILSLRQKNGGKLCGAFRLGRMSSSMVKPLALGSGIASLALASCTESESELVGDSHVPALKEEARVIGKICAPPEKVIAPRPAEKRTESKVVEPVHPDILLGDICIPPAKPNKEAL